MSATAEQMYDSETGECFDDAPTGWVKGQGPVDVSGLDWAGEKLAEVQRLISETQRLEGEAIARFLAAQTARTERILAPLRKRAAFFETHIRAYAEAHRADLLRGQDSRKKSRTLPGGLRLTWKHDPGGYRWDDAMKESERTAAIANWASEHGGGPAGLLDYTPRPRLDAIKTYLAERATETQRAAAPPGLKYVEPGDELRITTGAESAEEQ